MGLTMSDKPRNFATRTIHAGEQFSVADNAIFPAIVTASSFTKRSLDDKPEYSYSRVGNPTRHAYETCVAALEEGVGAVACASGVNATATVLELLPAGPLPPFSKEDGEVVIGEDGRRAG